MPGRAASRSPRPAGAPADYEQMIIDGREEDIVNTSLFTGVYGNDHWHSGLPHPIPSQSQLLRQFPLHRHRRLIRHRVQVRK